MQVRAVGAPSVRAAAPPRMAPSPARPPSPPARPTPTKAPPPQDLPHPRQGQSLRRHRRHPDARLPRAAVQLRRPLPASARTTTRPSASTRSRSPITSPASAPSAPSHPLPQARPRAGGHPRNLTRQPIPHPSAGARRRRCRAPGLGPFFGSDPNEAVIARRRRSKQIKACSSAASRASRSADTRAPRQEAVRAGRVRLRPSLNQERMSADNHAGRQWRRSELAPRSQAGRWEVESHQQLVHVKSLHGEDPVVCDQPDAI